MHSEALRVPNLSRISSDRQPANHLHVRAHHHLLRARERLGHLYIIIDGWAARYELLPDGRRQITGLYLPGDLCDAGWLDLEEAPHTVVGLTPLAVARASLADVARRARSEPRFMEFLMSELNAGAMIQQAWCLSLGRRSATEQIAHFFCELFVRLKQAGRTRGDRCDMPLTQSDIADCTGLTPIHVNRVLQDMRRQQFLELSARQLRIPDFERLANLGLFNGRYLATRTQSVADYFEICRA